ncbi:MAG: Gfo/Idh/MocA family oxidoreductase [Christensenella sp.]
MRTIKIGLVGCGNICDIYLQNSKKFGVMEIVAVADAFVERAEDKAKEYDIKKVCSVDQLMADPQIDVVLNLTNPSSHYDVSMAALRAGKHVYSEKSLAVTCEQGKEIVELAKEKGLRVGCAPDTFMGGRLQTCRKLIDDGWIGKPIAATAFMTCHGHEIWHPGPAFFYQVGAGPMFDMGPYYVTALIALLGPAKRVSGAVQKTFEKRMITSEPLNGQEIDVEIPTHISGTVEFEKGAVATLITSFDIWDSHLPRLEIYGTEGTLSLSEADPLAGPNLFEGKIHLRRKDEADWNGFPSQIPRQDATDWKEIPVAYGYNENSRGIGLADMCYAIQSGRQHRANGDMAFHALEIMHGIHDAAEQGVYHVMQSTCEQPQPMQVNLPDYTLDK